MSFDKILDLTAAMQLLFFYSNTRYLVLEIRTPTYEIPEAGVTCVERGTRDTHEPQGRAVGRQSSIPPALAVRLNNQGGRKVLIVASLIEQLSR